MGRCGLVVAIAALIVLLGFQNQAVAQTAVCSPTRVAAGGFVTVSGQGFAPNTAVNLFINGLQIAGGQTGALGQYSLTGRVPADTPIGPRRLTVQGTALVPAPPTPTAVAATAGCDVVVAGAVVRDPDRVRDRDRDRDRRAPRDPAPAPVQQQQQQQQQQVAVPATAQVPRGASLPKTGIDAGEVGGVGAATLVLGASLMQIARRRRNAWIEPATASEARAQPYTPPAPGPRTSGGSEGELLLPYWDRNARN